MYGLDILSGETHYKRADDERFRFWSAYISHNKRGQKQMCNSVDFNEGINFAVFSIFPLIFATTAPHLFTKEINNTRCKTVMNI